MDESDDAPVTLEEIIAALTTLPRKEQELFYMLRSDGRSFAEIAEYFGISIKRVERRLTKILTHIRHEVARQRKRRR
jgi:transmembrane sensor